MNNREVVLLSCFLLCVGAFELSGKDIQGSIGDSENSPKNPKIIADNKPVGDEGNLLEHGKKSKEDDQEAEEEEGFDPKDVAFDFDEDPSRVTIDERKGEENEPEEDPVLHSDKENNDGASEDPFEDSIVEVDVQLVEDKGELLEQEQNIKQDEQEVGMSVISDEEFGPKDVGFDPAEDRKKATTDEVRDEPAKPEEDPSHFGDTKEPWKRFFKHPVALNNNQPIEDEGNLPEKDEDSEKDDQLNENSVVHGEEFSPEDAGFDTDKISAGTIVDGITDEGGEPEDDPKNFASNPCSRGKYKLLNTYDRLVGNKDQSSVKCDQRDIALPGWFRFTGAAGDRMPTKCPGTKRCGTHAPGWLNGKHPSVADGIVSRDVCYQWSKNCCRWKNKINVKNCGAFYLYELQKPPACSLRYCGEATECSVGGYQELNQADRAMGNSNQSRVQCDGRAPDNILVPKWYRMTGDSGDQIPEKCVPMRRCGTHAPGWLNGKHPRLQEGVVSRQVCYHWTGGCCQWKNSVKIRNCGDFYVYELRKPPACSLRYCGNKEAPTTQPPIIEPTQSPGVNVTCVKDEMFISIPKKFLPGIRVDHLRLSDMNCGATETQTHFILRTELKECHTTSRDTKNSFCYKNKVLKISVEHQPIITRVREVEIPFSCCYSNTGIVSSVALKVESKKIVLSKDGFGEFVLEMKIFPDNRYIDSYKSEDFPVTVPSGKILYVEVNVDTEDLKLEILAETCFGTPDPNPIKPGLKYLFISDGCAVDDTLKFLPSNDEKSQKFSLAAFKFLGDHQFAYLHCKVKICNATDPKSRCAKGCLREARGKRSLNTRETNDEEYILAQGPFARAENDDDETESHKPMEITEVQNSGPYSTLVAAVVVVSVVFCVTCGSILAWKKKKRSAVRSYQLYTVPSGN